MAVIGQKPRDGQSRSPREDLIHWKERPDTQGPGRLPGCLRVQEGTYGTSASEKPCTGNILVEELFVE